MAHPLVSICAAPRSQLRFLTLTNCELTALPPVVCGMSSLLLLKLNINKLQVWGRVGL